MFEVVGKQKVDYVSKKDNDRKIGISLFCVCDGGNNVEGKSVEKLYISDKNELYGFAKSLPVGSLIKVTYNRYGSVAEMTQEPAKEAAK